MLRLSPQSMNHLAGLKESLPFGMMTAAMVLKTKRAVMRREILIKLTMIRTILHVICSSDTCRLVNTLQVGPVSFGCCSLGLYEKKTDDREWI